jgi:hypothetical protein
MMFQALTHNYNMKLATTLGSGLSTALGDTQNFHKCFRSIQTMKLPGAQSISTKQAEREIERERRMKRKRRKETFWL